MNLVAIEAPATRVAPTREALELLDAPLRIVTARQSLQVVADKLIEALAEGVRLLSGASYKLLIDGQGNIHLHSICAHVPCVNAEVASLASSSDRQGTYLWMRDLPLGEHVGPREQRSFLDDWRLVLCCATPSGDCCTHTQIAVGATCHGQAHRNRKRSSEAVISWRGGYLDC